MKVSNAMLNPEIRFQGIVMRTALPFFTQKRFLQVQKVLNLLKKTKCKSMDCRKLYIDRTEENGISDKLRICIYRPKNRPSQKQPGVLWIHGGGYCFGVPEQDEYFIEWFVNRFGCTVISPDYCLAPQAPYPAALKDCYSALSYLKDNADSLNVDTSRLFVGGGSAGGGLTAALSIYARDKGEIALAFQMPLYPMIDDRMDTQSYLSNDAPSWNAKSSASAWPLYLGDLTGTDSVPATAAPARLSDYSGLPPAVSYVGSIEPFRDETLTYFEKLRQAGVPAECKVFDGCYHVFDFYCRYSSAAKQAKSFLLDSFEYAVNHYRAEQPETRDTKERTNEKS